MIATYLKIYSDTFKSLMMRSYETGKSSVTAPVPTKKILEVFSESPYYWRINEKQLDEMIAYIKSEGIAIFKSKKGCWYDPKVQEIADKLKEMK